MVDQQTVSTLSLINRGGPAPSTETDLGAQLLVDLAAWEDEDAAASPPARQVLWLPVPLAGRVALAAVRRLRETLFAWLPRRRWSTRVDDLGKASRVGRNLVAAAT